MAEKVHSLNPKSKPSALRHVYDSASICSDTAYLYNVNAPIRKKEIAPSNREYISRFLDNKGMILKIIYKVIKYFLLSVTYPFYIAFYLIPKGILKVVNFLKDDVFKKVIQPIRYVIKKIDLSFTMPKIPKITFKLNFRWPSFDPVYKAFQKLSLKVQQRLLKLYRPIDVVVKRVSQKISVTSDKIKNLRERFVEGHHRFQQRFLLFLKDSKSKIYNFSHRLIKIVEKLQHYYDNWAHVELKFWEKVSSLLRLKQGMEFLRNVKKFLVWVLSSLNRQINRTISYIGSIFAYPVLGFKVVCETIYKRLSACFQKISGMALLVLNRVKVIKKAFHFPMPTFKKLRSLQMLAKKVRSKISLPHISFKIQLPKINVKIKRIKFPRLARFRDKSLLWLKMSFTLCKEFLKEVILDVKKQYGASISATQK